MWFLCLGLVLMAWWRFDRTKSKAKPAEEPKPGKAVAAASTLGGLYVLFSVWTFFAWYRMHKPNRRYKWGGDGWMGPETYAGGADKCGHAWATMALARLGSAMLIQWGGFSRKKAALFNAALSEALFAGVEVKDGFYYEFSFSDLTGDTVGAVLAYLFDAHPRINELFAYRVEYLPSEMYKRKVAGTSPCPTGGCSRWNIAEDYSGQTYLAALHLGGIGAVRDKLGPASRFVDVAAGFRTRNYRPLPDHDVTEMPHQDLFLGLALNAQGFFDWLLEDKDSAAAERVRQVLHGFFEVFQLPYGSLRLLQTSREGPMRYEKGAPRRAPLATTRRRRQPFVRARRETTGS